MTDTGEKLQVYAQHIGREWHFFQRQKRYDQWKRIENAPLEDWLELLDAVQRLITRRRYQPDDEQEIRMQIREIYPEADV